MFGGWPGLFAPGDTFYAAPPPTPTRRRPAAYVEDPLADDRDVQLALELMVAHILGVH